MSVFERQREAGEGQAGGAKRECPAGFTLSLNSEFPDDVSDCYCNRADAGWQAGGAR